MSIQETKLLAVADAIREKEGSTGFIPAEDFAARILALQDSASGYSMPLRLEVNPGAEVTAQNGEDVLTGIADADGNLTFLLPKPGTWTVTAALDGKEKTEDVAVEDFALNFVSRLPDGYQEVEYIHTVAATGFNSGINCNSTAMFNSFRCIVDFEADAYTGSAAQYLCSSTGTSFSGTGPFSFMITRKNASSISYMLGKASTSVSATMDISNIRLIFDCDMGNKTFKVGSEVFTFASSIGTLKSWTPTIFSIYASSNAVPGKLYSTKMYFGDELVRDFVPCIDPTGTVGLYDLVNGVFYMNSKNGVLTAGPTV